MTTDAPILPLHTKLTKPQRALIRRLSEFPAEQWLDDKKLADGKMVELLESLAMVESDPTSLAFRLTAAGREIAEKYGESKFVKRQRHTIDRVAAYWTNLFEIVDLRDAFRLALTRILSRELRLTPEMPMSVCVCSRELAHDAFPHHCQAAVPRTIAVVAHCPDDVLLETIHKIGLVCSGHRYEGSAVGLLPAYARVWINDDVITAVDENARVVL